MKTRRSQPFETLLNAVQLLALTVLAGAFGGCSSTSPDEPKANEIPTSDVVAADLPQEQLFMNAKRAYASGIHTVAMDSFQKLKDSFSPGPYSEFAEIKLADSQFEGREFDTAAGMYEAFLKDHPASSALPYVMLRAGRSLELSNRGIGRNVLPLEKARDMYQRLIEQFPDSVYAASARDLLAGVTEKLAAYEIMVGEFYKNRDNSNAFLARTEVYTNKWQPLVESAKKDAEVKRAADSVPIAPAETAIAAASSETAASTTAIAKKTPRNPLQTQSVYKIHNIQCGRGSSGEVLIFLNQEMANAAFLTSNAELEPADERVKIAIPDCASKEISLDCPHGAKITASSSCSIELESDEPLFLMALSNPPRLLLTK
ncbi:MAG: outer membrane protein assembly factor BamD [Deltaproteobacteria bacterium]|nr:outer membrane protein assembly factor BamD [Deltaproteobacteria bacterium]